MLSERPMCGRWNSFIPGGKFPPPEAGEGGKTPLGRGAPRVISDREKGEKPPWARSAQSYSQPQAPL